MNRSNAYATLLAVAALFAATGVHAQTAIGEDFTTDTTANAWWFFNGACLTASSKSGSEPLGNSHGQIPGCTSIASSYYNKTAGEHLVGGMGLTNTNPDPSGSGALRFTNGYPYGYKENGGIVNATPFPTGQGVSITFKTVTYLGNSGGAGGDGADGISFFLMDASQLNTSTIDSAGSAKGDGNGLGAWGGSLGYSCSNSNTPYNGLNGGYLGLGIDEYGNFLNGTTNTLGETGTTASGDNTATGGGYKPNRIGLRGAGNVSFYALSTAYGTNPNDPTKPYYPASLVSSCGVSSGVLNSAGDTCETCAAGYTYDVASNSCTSQLCATGVYNTSTGKCDTCAANYTFDQTNNICTSHLCAAGTGSYNGSTGLCEACPANYTYVSATNTCTSTMCASGTWSASQGSCETCPAGYTYSSGSNTCTSTLCAAGTGSYSASTGKCELCPAGYSYSSGTTCTSTLCASGTYNATLNKCETCPANYTYQSSSNTCTSQLCASGTYNPTLNNCETCPVNYTYNVGPNTCTSTLCASGTYNAGQGKCETCSTGTYNSGPNVCEICATGTYNAALVKCETCPAGYTYNSGPNTCTKGASTVAPAASNPSTAAPTASNPLTATPTASGTKTAAPTASNTLTATATASNTLTASPTPSPPMSTSPTGTGTLTAAPAVSGTKVGSPSGHPVDWLYAVQNTCKNATLYNYATPAAPTSAGPTQLTNPVNTGNPSAGIPPILDYGALPGGYVVLPTGTQIANEAATSRNQATLINYQLNISQNGLLSLSYAICPPSGCGAYQSIITKQDITAANGPLPANFLFGFAGSTGGSSNIHEILCFQAQPQNQAASSAGASERQASKLESGTQAYFAYYNPSNGWTGRVTASDLLYDSYGNITIAATPHWDAECVLSGVPAGFNCPTTGVPGVIAPQGAANRVMLTWNGTGGVPLQWNSLSSAQQTALDAGDVATVNCNAGTPYAVDQRLSFLRGDRSCEINTQGVGLFRRRTGVLADIIDSSPVWIGPPNSPYAAVWLDRLNSSDPLPENNGTSSYAQYSSSNVSRQQVVYVGANDGLLHGFRSGTYNTTTKTWTNNDGKELIAYMPGAVVQSIHSTTANVDYSNPQYGHAFFEDATPGVGDLMYNGQWHSWVVSGLGAGGSSIFALDVTDPTTFTEGNASSLVIGEWTPATISCQNASNCGNNLGNTYGTPLIRRLHDGNWAIIFGNGFGSASGDAGIYVGVITSNPGNPTFYYLSTHTGSLGSPNGIAYTTAADLDGDHITDYVYAGDLQGNVWRFDLTSSVESNWALSGTAPLFTTASGQPITTQLVVASGAPSPGMMPQVMVLFGTGQKTPLSNLSAATYAPGTQSLYGFWDWNLTGWNALSTTTQYAALAPSATGLSGNYTLAPGNLVTQTVTISTYTYTDSAGTHTVQNRDIAANAAICWAGQGGCTGSSAQFGWMLNFPGTQEQLIFNPGLVSQALTLNTIVPASNIPTTCTILNDTGFTYVLSALTGGAFNQVFLPPSVAANTGLNNYQALADPHAIGTQTNATGSSFIVSNAAGTQFLVYETNQTQQNGANGTSNLQGGATGLNLPPNTTGRRLNWIQLR